MTKQEIETRKNEFISAWVQSDIGKLEEWIEKYYHGWFREKPIKKHLRTWEIDSEIEYQSAIHFAAQLFHRHRDCITLKALVQDLSLDVDEDWVFIDKTLKLIKDYVEPILFKKLEKLWPDMRPHVQLKYKQEFGGFYRSINRLEVQANL